MSKKRFEVFYEATKNGKTTGGAVFTEASNATEAKNKFKRDTEGQKVKVISAREVNKPPRV